MSDAIQSDVSEIKRTPLKRDEILAEIAQKHEEKRAEELGIEIEEPEQEDSEIDPEEPEQEAAKKEEPQPENKQEELVEIIVEGERRKVPLSQIVDAGKRTLQKESTADKRLEEATRIKRQAEEATKALQAPSADPQLNELVQTIQYGTPEEAGQALAKAMEIATKQAMERNQAIPRPEDILTMVDQHLTVRDAFEKIKTEYKDVIDDPYLFNLAVSEDNALQQSGDPRHPYERMKDACEKVKKWKEDKFKVAKQAASLDEKRERKRNIDNIPTANAKPEAPQKEEEEETPSQIIARMAAERGRKQIRR